VCPPHIAVEGDAAAQGPQRQKFRRVAKLAIDFQTYPQKR
jgi:hypothetical protein